VNWLDLIQLTVLETSDVRTAIGEDGHRREAVTGNDAV